LMARAITPTAGTIENEDAIAFSQWSDEQGSEQVARRAIGRLEEART